MARPPSACSGPSTDQPNTALSLQVRGYAARRKRPRTTSKRQGPSRDQSWKKSSTKLPKLWQDAQIAAEQIEPVLRRRLPISLPSQAGQFDMIVEDFNSRWLPFGKGFGRTIANAEVGLAQNQPRYDLSVHPKKIEQMNQH